MLRNLTCIAWYRFGDNCVTVMTCVCVCVCVNSIIRVDVYMIVILKFSLL